jgi:hypothetical protein
MTSVEVVNTADPQWATRRVIRIVSTGIPALFPSHLHYNSLMFLVSNGAEFAVL